MRPRSIMPRGDYINPNAPSVVDEAIDVPLEGLALPAVCSKCDAGTESELVWRTERIAWTSAGTYALAILLVPLGLIFTIVVLAVRQKSITVVIPVCTDCDARWRNAKIVRALALLSPIGIGFLVGTLAATPDGTGMLVGLGAFVASLVVVPLFAVAFVVRPATIHAKYITTRARLLGFSESMRSVIAREPDGSLFLTSKVTPAKSPWGGILLIAALIGLPAVAVLGVLSVYGVRKYVATAKVMEARTSLAAIARSAASAHARDGRLCSSASQPVPADASALSAGKYQSTPAEWSRDGATAGFECLGVSLTRPQYYQYDYHATYEGFTATARGDLNGDGMFSTLEIEGRVEGANVTVSEIKETNPEE